MQQAKFSLNRHTGAIQNAHHANQQTPHSSLWNNTSWKGKREREKATIKKEREKNEKSKRERAVLKKAEGHSSTLFDPSSVSLEEVGMYTPVCYSGHWASHSYCHLFTWCKKKQKKNTVLPITFHFRGDLSPIHASCPNLLGGLIKWRHLLNEKYPEV